MTTQPAGRKHWLEFAAEDIIREENKPLTNTNILVAVVICFCCCCLASCIAVGAVIATVLNMTDAEDNNNVGEEILVDFDNTLFDLFEFTAICEELINRTLIDADNDEFFISEGISVCFGGHRVVCDSSLTLTGFHCPTAFDSACGCEQGAINIHELDQLECNAGEDFYDAYELIGGCQIPVNEFNVIEIFAASDPNKFSGGNVGGGLNVFNSFVESCVDNQSPFGVGVSDNSIFEGCINDNLSFECFGFEYIITPEPCPLTPGIEFSTGK